MRFRFDGKEQTFSLGDNPDISLSEARATQATKLKIKAGINPAGEKKALRSPAAEPVPGDTFRSIAHDWFSSRKKTWSEKYADQRDYKLHLDPIMWGYQPAWTKEAGRPPLINARTETAATGRMFKPLWNSGRALVMADGWYEWKKDPDDAKIKQPYFIYHESKEPIFLAAISRFHPDALDAPEDDGLVIVTAASDKGLINIHDRRPLVMTREASLERLSPETTPKRAEELAYDFAIPAYDFAFHHADKTVGNSHNNNESIIKHIDIPVSHPTN